MLKYKAVLKQPLPEDLAARHENFDEVLKRASGNNKPKKNIVVRLVSQSPWAAAACLVLLLSGVSYAVYILQSYKKPIAKKSSPVQINAPNAGLNYTTYVIPTNKWVEIITKDSLKIEIPAYTLAAAKRKSNGIVSVTDLEPIKINGGYRLNIQLEKSEEKELYLSHKLFSPTVKLYYGGNGIRSNDWKEVPILSETFIKTPTPAMNAYLQYVQSSALIDSIDRYYYLKNHQYIHFSKKEFSYQKNFIDQVRRSTKAYKTYTNRAEMIVVQRQWHFYQQQHQIEKLKNELEKLKAK